MRLSDPHVEINAEEVLVSTELSGIEPAGEIRFRFPPGFAPGEDAVRDAMFPIGLMLAMATSGRLTLDFPISDRLARAGKQINEIYKSWFPKKLSEVVIDVPVRPDDPTPLDATPTGISAFTGGVDSFATALRNKSTIRSHFYVFGYDLPLDREFRKLRANVRQNLESAAGQLEKRMAFVTTNLRRFLNPHTNWAAMSHGPAIASVAHMLSESHNTLYIPSSFTYKDLQPWGSHPLVDPLWSSDRLRVLHDGAHLSRVEKTLLIASEEAVRDHLRVCLSKRTDYNCGECVKCIRTMLGLELAGELAETRVFPNVLDLEAVRDITLSTQSQLIFMDELVRYSELYERPDIADALRVSISRYDG